MHPTNRPWIKKKNELMRKQEEYNDAQSNSTKKLKRTHIKSNGKISTDFEIWPAELQVLQRIANYMERPTTPTQVELRLNKGEFVTNKYGDVYSLVSLTAHH